MASRDNCGWEVRNLPGDSSVNRGSSGESRAFPGEKNSRKNYECMPLHKKEENAKFWIEWLFTFWVKQQTLA